MAFTALIDAETLTAHLDDPDWVVLDCRAVLTDPGGGLAAWRAGHLPGAAHVDLDAVLSGPRAPGSGRHPLPDPAALAAHLGALGVGAGTQVVCYDGGELAFAARAWWLLRWLGHRAVAVLDGGFRLWHDQGRPVGTDRPARRNAQRFTAQVDSALIADLDTLPGAGLLVDARAPERFRGEVEPLDPVAGHIPGAVNQPAAANLDTGGHLRDPAALRAQWQALLGAHEPREVVCYCGSGVSACVNLLALEVAGLPGARLYAGSWSQWCTDPSRPVERG